MDLDVVIVPDFLGPRAMVFEARTLFFLASWMKIKGNQQIQGKLYIVSIGEPPKSVQQMAAVAGAVLYQQQAFQLQNTGFSNKLRGLEITSSCKGCLLLDVDIFLIGDLLPLANVSADIVAGIANKPRIAEAEWEKVYSWLDIPLPSTREIALFAQYDLVFNNEDPQFPTQQEEARAMLPYYNSGVIYTQCRSRLREVWGDHFCKLEKYFEARKPQLPKAKTQCDQFTFATAIQALKVENKNFELLPPQMNVRMPHVKAGAIPFKQTSIFHATGFLHNLKQREDLQNQVQEYAQYWCDCIKCGLHKRPIAKWLEQRKIQSYLQNLLHHVEPFFFAALKNFKNILLLHFWVRSSRTGDRM